MSARPGLEAQRQIGRGGAAGRRSRARPIFPWHMDRLAARSASAGNAKATQWRLKCRHAKRKTQPAGQTSLFSLFSRPLGFGRGHGQLRGPNASLLTTACCGAARPRSMSTERSMLRLPERQRRRSTQTPSCTRTCRPTRSASTMCWLLLGKLCPPPAQLDAQIQADGPLHVLGGSGWVELDGGRI